MDDMPRAATTADPFNAIAEPRRRELLDVLAAGERPVGELAGRTGMTQPQVSKHLKVLREVGLVQVREAGRLRLYRINGPALKPVHDWAAAYVHTWQARLEALDDVLEELKTDPEEMQR